MTVFVNPYTFVPFAEPQGEGFRTAPAGHDRLGEGRFLGEIDVELVTRSPLLLRGIARSNEPGAFPRRTLPSGQSVPFVPGSSLAGVTRSMFEMIAGGCLRIFDSEFVPGYRDQAVARGAEWTLVRVLAVDDEGRPTRLHRCERVVWVPAPELARILGGTAGIVSGATIDVLNWRHKRLGGRVERLEAAEAGDIREGKGWVVLVTDAGARQQGKSYFCAVGQLAAGDGSQLAGVTDQAWANYRASAAGTDDIRRARTKDTLRPDKPVEADVTYLFADGPHKVGVRHEARLVLFPGQVLWARIQQDQREEPQVAELALSAIWRHPGARKGALTREAAGDRVPSVLRPCRDPAELCPACRVFGSVDAEGADDGDGRAEQRSYRGHVRFSDALPVGQVSTRSVHLAPLGEPRPGAGQFYLESPQGQRTALGTPLREWGSAADARKPRGLNGRKQYWLTGRHQERPLFRVTDGPFDGELAATAEAVAEQSVFTYTVRFNGLSPAEIGGLLAALSPAQVLADRVPHAIGDPVIGLAVGGGRSFGFGTCTTRVAGLRVHNARSYYLGQDPPAFSVGAAVREFTAAVDAGVQSTWSSLAAALHLDHVDPAKVWYPPAKSIPKGPLRKADLEPGFEFWKQTRGFQHTHGEDPLLPLPDADAESQELPVLRREARRRNNPGGPAGGRR